MGTSDDGAFLRALSHTSLGLVPLVLAVVFGVAAYQIQQRWRMQRHPPLLLGLIVVWVFLLTNVLLTLAGLFHVGCAQLTGRRAGCHAVMKSLGEAAMQYAQDYDDTFPPVAHWEVALKPYLKIPLKCPSVKRGSSYAMNKALSKKKLEALENPAEVILFFESDNGTTVAQKRHGGSQNFTFADGHAKRVSENNQKVLAWDTFKPTKKASRR